MNKRINNMGFTLVELLSVMVILISISLVVVVSVTSSLDRRGVKECEEQQELAVGVAKIYFSLEDKSSVKISELKAGGYFKDNKKVDKLNDEDKITISNNEYLYNGLPVGESCS